VWTRHPGWSAKHRVSTEALESHPALQGPSAPAALALRLKLVELLQKLETIISLCRAQKLSI
jgi:hypothetical protein